ncbi:hypothetical protein N665_0171s0050 [Sinapis alba]|nr:hypothetical protein N665_0171s0050 [Sinapis alba]
MGKEKQAIASSSSSSSSSSSQTKRRKIRRTIRKRRRRNEKLVTAPPSLPNDVVEEIFLRLPVKALIRLKSLSKHWRSTIQSSSFEKKHLKMAAERSHDVDHPNKVIMVISEEDPFKGSKNNLPRPDTDVGFRTFCLESASHVSFTRLNFPQGFHHWIYVSESCDGLFCIYSVKTHSIYVVNPATRWLRQLPPAMYQVLLSKVNNNPLEDGRRDENHLAFVKADTGYKLVWLYNNNNNNNNDDDDSNETSLVTTKCEVFDFKANTWRYLTCTPSYRIFRNQTPASANRSLYWFTEPYNSKIQVVAFDIHTETFKLLPQIVSSIATSDPQYIDMCTLDNGLCMSKRQGDTMIQEIWRLKPSQDSWEKVYTIDLLSCSSSSPTKFGDEFDWGCKDLVEPFTPVAICKNKKNILLSHRYTRTLVKLDPQAKSLSCFFKHRLCTRRYVPYFQSLISHI